MPGLDRLSRRGRQSANPVGLDPRSVRRTRDRRGRAEFSETDVTGQENERFPVVGSAGGGWSADLRPWQARKLVRNLRHE